jgi:molecular chaperone DnaJ
MVVVRWPDRPAGVEYHVRLQHRPARKPLRPAERVTGEGILGTDDAYAELGLNRGASEAEVKAAWRKLVSRWHPDRNRSATAVGRMQRINQAFEAIRAAGFHDTGAPAGGSASSAGASERETAGRARPGRPHGPHESAADRSRGGSSRFDDEAGDEPDPANGPGADRADADEPVRTVQRKVRLSLEEAALGCIKVLRGKLSDPCRACAATGYHPITSACAACEGSGSVRQRAWFGWVGAATECEACHGNGRSRRVCGACAGAGKRVRSYEFKVRIPPGARDGDLLHVDGRQPRNGQPAVDLDLRIAVAEHPFFHLDDDGTLRCEIPVDAFAWIANRTVQVPTVAGLQPLHLDRDRVRYRLPGHGFPVERRGRRGDLVVHITPQFPQRLSTDQQILLDQLVATGAAAAGTGASPRLDAWNETLRVWAAGRDPGG